MTKKDFILLAAALKQARPAGYTASTRGAGETWLTTCESIADACATTNPLFDRPKFLDACGTNT